MSTYLRQQMAETITEAVRMSLHTDDPGGSGLNEISGGGYARVSIASWNVQPGPDDTYVATATLSQPFALPAETVVTWAALWTSDDATQVAQAPVYIETVGAEEAEIEILQLTVAGGTPPEPEVPEEPGGGDGGVQPGDNLSNAILTSVLDELTPWIGGVVDLTDYTMEGAEARLTGDLEGPTVWYCYQPSADGYAALALNSVSPELKAGSLVDFGVYAGPPPEANPQHDDLVQIFANPINFSLYPDPPHTASVFAVEAEGTYYFRFGIYGWPDLPALEIEPYLGGPASREPGEIDPGEVIPHAGTPSNADTALIYEQGIVYESDVFDMANYTLYPDEPPAGAEGRELAAAVWLSYTPLEEGPTGTVLGVTDTNASEVDLCVFTGPPPWDLLGDGYDDLTLVVGGRLPMADEEPPWVAGIVNPVAETTYYLRVGIYAGTDPMPTLRFTVDGGRTIL